MSSSIRGVSACAPALILAIAAGRAAGQVPLYVDSAAPDGGNGLSWASPLRSLQDALGAAQASGGLVTEIRVAHGDYKPDHGLAQTVGDRAAVFELLDGIPIRGGYAGFGAADPDLRSPAAFPTVLLGDLLGDDGPGFANTSDNSLHVVHCGAANATLDGVTIRGGHATIPLNPTVGGGVLVEGGPLLLVGCTLDRNAADNRGGGLDLESGSVTLESCTLTGNQALHGGGVSTFSGTITIRGCTFQANRAQDGAAALLNQARATVADSTFTAQQLIPGGGGGAVISQLGEAAFTGCSFTQNPTLGLATSNGRSLIDRCTFTANTNGGASCGDTSVLVMRSTFVANHASSGGGLYLSPGGTGEVGLYSAGVASVSQWNGTRWADPAPGGNIAGGAGAAAAVFNDGTGSALYIGGSFASAGSGPGMAFLARLDGGGLTPVGGGVGGPVSALAVFNDGRGPALYAGGSFTSAGGGPAAHIARWDGSSWTALGPGTDGPVAALCIFDNGAGPALYAGGSFSSAGGVPCANVARWDGQQWAALGPGLDGPVVALAAATAGTPGLFAGGEFLGSGAVPCRRVARWNGSQWTGLGGGIAAGRVLALSPGDGGINLFVGGDALVVNGSVVAESRVARWDGGAWTALPSGGKGAVHALARFGIPGGAQFVHAGGDFDPGSGLPGRYVSRWGGAGWSALGAGPPDPPRALAPYDNHARTVVACRFFGNAALNDGGAVYGGDVIAGCVMSGNTAQNGGGIFCGSADIVNCTLASNTAGGSGGGIRASLTGANTPRVTNSIVYFNTDGGGNLQASQISTLSTGSVALSYSCVQNLTGSWGGPGNIALNPLFVNRAGPDNIIGTADDNLRPLSVSPVIDRGSTAALALPLAADADGLARVADGDHNGSAQIDMGAYEYHTPPCYPNCDGSTLPPVLNVNDFQCFLNRYAVGDTYANCDGSTTPPILNVNDFQCFLNAFAVGCP